MGQGGVEAISVLYAQYVHEDNISDSLVVVLIVRRDADSGVRNVRRHHALHEPEGKGGHDAACD